MLDHVNLLEPSLLMLFAIGAIAGVLAALLGIGGGLIMVPVLTIWGATPVQAVATSLIGIVFSSISGTYQNWKMKFIDPERVALLAFPAMLSTELGVWLANLLPAEILLISFAALQIGAIYLIDLKQRLKRKHRVIHPANQLPPDTGYSSASTEYGPLHTQAPSKPVVDPKILPTQGIGLLAGALSGLFGVGGGIVMVPLQMLFLEETIKDAVRTSLGAITLISIWALGRHALSGNVLWLAGVYLGLGGLLGAQFGARLLPKLPDTTVSLLFRGLLFVLAIYMVGKALAGWGFHLGS
ncbi:MAG TPA: sulfite exporter TauE/SafE family protein [Crinalium sp.]